MGWTVWFKWGLKPSQILNTLTVDQPVILRWRILTLGATRICFPQRPVISYFRFGMFNPRLSRPAAWSGSFHWWWLQNVAPWSSNCRPRFSLSPLKFHILWRNWERGSERRVPWFCFCLFVGGDQEKKRAGRVGIILCWWDLYLEFLLLQSSQNQCVLLFFFFFGGGEHFLVSQMVGFHLALQMWRGWVSPPLSWSATLMIGSSARAALIILEDRKASPCFSPWSGCEAEMPSAASCLCLSESRSTWSTAAESAEQGWVWHSYQETVQKNLLSYKTHLQLAPTIHLVYNTKGRIRSAECKWEYGSTGWFLLLLPDLIYFFEWHKCKDMGHSFLHSSFF